MKFKYLFLNVIVFTLLGYSCSETGDSYKPEWIDRDRMILIKNLTHSLDSLRILISNIPEEELNQRPDSNSWSIAEVVEHLVLQDQAFYRELTAISSRPEETAFIEKLETNDAGFLAYATDPNPSQADWFAVPTGNYKDFKIILNQFISVRNETINFVKETKADLRRHYTYRTIPDHLLDMEFYRIRKVRDLHQLMLNEIAHTYRHLGQIIRIKEKAEGM